MSRAKGRTPWRNRSTLSGVSYVFAQPPALAAAATELAGLGTAIGEAAAVAAAPTTALMTAAADEVSTAIAAFFGGFGQEFQTVSAQLGTLYQGLVQNLNSTIDYYVNAEAINTAQLRQSVLRAIPLPDVPPVFPPFTGDTFSIAMGGTGTPIPGPTYLDNVNKLFIIPNSPAGTVLTSLFTPEQLYPITGVRSLIFASSVQQGLQILNTAVMNEVTAGNHAVVFGYSQSAVISSLLMQYYSGLAPGYAPPFDSLSFVLIGNEMNPNGGILARIPGLDISTVGLPFYGAMPNTLYPTTTYTLQYDGFADFPRYPLNIVSDINAIFGIITVHTTYADLTPAQVQSATLLPTTGATTNRWFMIDHPNLPLLDPVRAIPVIGEPIAALVQPNLKVIVNLGYGDPNFGYSTSYADVPTPFGLFPEVPPGVIADALVKGTQQGINDFMAVTPHALTTAPVIQPPAFPPLIQAYMTPPPQVLPPTPVNIANTVASVVSTGYSVLLPTADLLTAFATTMPAYDLTLFLSQLAQGNLRAAIELPLAATAGLAALGGMIEFIAVVEAAADIAQDLQSIGL
ncbi:PE family protein [Mycobacterium paragordonae]|uniref:PE family protein n=1 Tax=Mycobacterium paragordonae TaxID=1389713 RepID=A0ABQ1CDY1_9MYCO|nr:PE family protein [Mycobacterium paragordonae]GFG82716.1 PE family protein [Mycobacterium paragordonae]